MSFDSYDYGPVIPNPLHIYQIMGGIDPEVQLCPNEC